MQLTPNEQLAKMERHTNEDGSVELQFNQWEPVTNEDGEVKTVECFFSDPLGNEHRWEWDWPYYKDMDNEFVRLVVGCGYTLENAELMNSDNDITITADVSGRKNFIIYPDDFIDKSFTEKYNSKEIYKNTRQWWFKSFFGIVSIFLSFIMTIILIMIVIGMTVFALATNTSMFSEIIMVCGGIFGMSLYWWTGDKYSEEL